MFSRVSPLKYENITSDMHTTMLAFPQPGAQVGIPVESGRLVVEPHYRRRYTLDELLAKCNPSGGEI
jgi:hypothetical protein